MIKNNIHLLLYIAIAGLSAWEIVKGTEILWFSITLVINILLIGIEIFFSFGAGKVTRDEIDAKAKQEKLEFENFMIDNNK